MKTKILVYACVALLSFTSCEDWLSQNDPKELSEGQAYSSVASISSIAANLYERIKLDQNFASDNESYDICRWDEATSNSYYWQFSSNVGRTYRNYYDYNLIRDINIHIRNLSEKTSHLPENQRAYFLGEARFLRAFTYFNMVKNLGGVPLITEVYDYSTTPIEYAKPRDTEAAVYEFVATEMDEVKEALDIAPQGSSLLTRATKASALALKSRAMLYAGTLAYNEDKSKIMGLTLTSGAVGISKNKATEYLQSCIDAYLELKEIGRYSLLKGTGSSLGENFNNVFVSKTNNPELILIRDYDGSTDFPNNFTVWNIPRSQRSTANFGGHVNPTLNLVESFETINSGSSQLNAYVGNEIIESMGNETSAYNYVLYDSPMGIFEGRDPRLWGTVILPGADFRGKEIQLQAGLAVKTASGYDLKMLDLIENVYDPDKNFYNGQQLTSIDGPIRNSYYTSHTGFLLRKYIDPVTGSEASGKSAVPYIIFRYGEILLNAAEAAYYLNQLGVANYKGSNTLQLSSDCLNEVRERAGGTAFRIESSDLTLALLQNERKIELAFEDHRFYDLKRWRIADQIWSGDWNTSTARMTGLWPYKVYAPGQPEDGKWLFRRVYIEHRGNDNEKGLPIRFGQDMYYAEYPMTEGNPYIEKNPKH